MRLFLLSLFVPGLASAGGFQRLYAEQATATSFLQSNWNKYQENYHPNYALDDDPKTAWVEGADGDGLGESLTIPVSNVKTARAVRLVVFNGYQKSAGLLGANAAPRQLTVTVHGPAGQPSALQKLTLERKLGPQSFDIPVKDGVAEVVLTLDSVHAGGKYRDTCISDVQVFVDSDVPYKPAVEKDKREKLLAWKKERLALAKYYASLPATYPYASTHFESKATHDTVERLALQRADGKPAPKPGEREPLLAQLQAGVLGQDWTEEDRLLLQELQTLSAEGTTDKGRWYTLSVKGRTVPPENLNVPAYAEPLLHPGDLTLFEARGPGKLDIRLTAKQRDEGGEVEARSNFRVLEGSATELKKVYFTHKAIISDRSTTTFVTHAIAQLEGGQLKRLLTVTQNDGDFYGTEHTVERVVPTYTDGKVSRLRGSRFNTIEFDAGTADAAEPPTLYLNTVELVAQTRS